MLNLTPDYTFNTSFTEVKFTPDAQHLWVLSRHALMVHDVKDKTQHLLWEDDLTSWNGFCFVQEHGVALVLGRHGAEQLVLAELDLKSGQELRRFYYLVSEILDQERSDIFISDDLFSTIDLKVFMHHEDAHLIAHCADECGEFFLHWSPQLDVNPFAVEVSFVEGCDGFAKLHGLPHVVMHDVLYDLEEGCVVANWPQKTFALHFNASTCERLRCQMTYDQPMSLVWCSGESAQMDHVTLERVVVHEDEIQSYRSIASSKDAQWLVCLDASSRARHPDQGEFLAHLGVWNTRTGRLHVESHTKDFDWYGGQLSLSSDQRAVCVSYAQTIELFTIQLPEPEEPSASLPDTQHADDYLLFSKHESLHPDWLECPLPYETISALSEKGVVYTGTGEKKCAHQLPEGFSWVDMAKPGSWRDQDPQGEFKVIAPMVWCVISHLEWPSGSWSIWDATMQERVGVEMIGGALEQLDCVVDGRRRLLHFIAYNDNQYFYAVDLLDRGADLPVFELDHDFSCGASIAFDRFVYFVKALSMT